MSIKRRKLGIVLFSIAALLFLVAWIGPMNWLDTQTAHIEIILKILTFSTLAVTVILAVRRFGLQRESATFLRVLVTTKEISKSGALVMTSVSVKLDNLGQTRIDARTIPRDSKGFLYDDGWDQLQHAGTLKIRPIAHAKEPLFFDWYSLQPMSIASTISGDAASYGEVTRRVRELEQINYLDDYQDPEKQFAECISGWSQKNHTNCWCRYGYPSVATQLRQSSLERKLVMKMRNIGHMFAHSSLGPTPRSRVFIPGLP